jgi:hypothetical protein
MKCSQFSLPIGASIIDKSFKTLAFKSDGRTFLWPLSIRILAVLAIVFALAQSLSAQVPTFIQTDYMPALKDGSYLEYPWAGGLNSAQICDADINNDGRKDLVIYEKTENRLLTLISVSPGKYDIQRAYAAHFPSIQGWIVMKDVTCDGVTDLFTFNNGSIVVYKGFFEQDSLRFELMSDGIFYEGFSGLINVYSSFVDRPAIADFDGDGDMDILTFNVTANRMLLYKNMVKERGYRCDTIAFKLDDNCWGNIYESGLSPYVDLRDTCDSKFPFPGRLDPFYNGENERRHAGSTVEAFDISGNGLLDVVMGDVTFSFVNYLPNTGTLTYASVLSQDTSFPAYDIPARTASFPLPVFIDIDQDGQEDLVVTPFEGFGVDNIENVLYYRNIGESSVQLSFQTRSLFVGDMIEVGENATPCFIDITGNGLKDLLIGGGVRLGDAPPVYKITYYRNVGFADFPIYTLEQEDYLGFSALGLNEPYPAAGDVTGDGKIDLLVGLADGRILLYPNQATGPGFVAGNPSLLKVGSADLDVGQNAAPCVVDLDRDGRRDLVVGERNGNVNYFRNAGGSGINVQWVEQTDSVGKIRTSTPSIPFGNSAPVVGDFNGDGKLDMIFGGFENTLSFVSNIQDSIFQRVSPQSLLGSVRMGRNLVPTVADITADGQLEMIVGTLAGGLYFYSENPPPRRPVSVNDRTDNQLEFVVYPNPNSGSFRVRVGNEAFTAPLSWQLFDAMGRMVSTGMLQDYESTVSVESISAGIYFLTIQSERQIGTQSIVIR